MDKVCLFVICMYCSCLLYTSSEIKHSFGRLIQILIVIDKATRQFHVIISVLGLFPHLPYQQDTELLSIKMCIRDRSITPSSPNISPPNSSIEKSLAISGVPSGCYWF